MAKLVLLKDNGGLLYPGSKLCKFVADLEESVTTCFSLLELRFESVLDMLDLVKKKQQTTLGCPEHAEAIAADRSPVPVSSALSSNFWPIWHYQIRKKAAVHVQKFGCASDASQCRTAAYHTAIMERPERNPEYRSTKFPVTKSFVKSGLSRHFVPSDYKEGRTTRRLKEGAVPSVFQEYPIVSADLQAH
ncbi:hypothetical protein HPB50_011813 [Hyalomma asiaticum]|uniref:Uncharacterized protein n=1 Tax=Hyalomma asiaticum TaxID=266040 RepID=A0ACB7RTW4_HYAAI|nr:hypothetical protein HPB50_011813 [Hyalomma asiaticum]